MGRAVLFCGRVCLIFQCFHQQKYFWRSGAKGAGIILGKALIWAGQRCTGSHLNLLMFGNRSVLFGRWGYLQHRWVGPAFRNTHTHTDLPPPLEHCSLLEMIIECMLWSVCIWEVCKSTYLNITTWQSQFMSICAQSLANSENQRLH